MHTKKLGIGIVSAFLLWGLAGVSMLPISGTSLLSRVMEKKETTDIPWRVLKKEDLQNGTSVPVNTHVVFTLPTAVSPSGSIVREALLGGQGTRIRYWGYCLPQATDPAPTDGTLPGKLFLSEAERKARTDEWKARQAKYTIGNLPITKADQAALELTKPPKSLIRHQKELFNPGDICYITVGGKTPLHIGTDLDGDSLNASLERANRTDPENSDSDADGISDGIEVLKGKTNPLRVDTDGDGLPDGTEDKDRDGNRDYGETDPINADSDKDGLVDGLGYFGRVNLICDPSSSGSCINTSRTWSAGEDKNLNGIVDAGETDPLKFSTDGIHGDYELYLSCRLAGNTDC